MSIELGWAVTTEVAKWLKQAINAAKNRRQQRFAHLVGNAGVIVSGLRSIDRELHRLFLPLIYLRPEEWPEEKRREWAERILALANEDVIMPSMRAADSALETLSAKESDPEIVGLIQQLRHINPAGYNFSNVFKEQGWVGDLLNAIVYIKHIDEVIINFIPQVVDGLIGVNPNALADVRHSATYLIAGKSSRHYPENRQPPLLRDI